MFQRLLHEILGFRRRADQATAFSLYENAERARTMSRFDEVEEHYRNAIELDPQSVALNYNLGLLLQQMGDVTGAEMLFQKVLRLQPNYQAAHSSFLCLGDFSTSMSRDAVYHRHLEWARRFADPLTRAAPQHKPRAESARLKIGYVSADFRRHVTGRFIEPVLRCHDRKRYEIFCYSNAVVPDDEMTTHLRGQSDHWREIAGISDSDLATLVRRDRVDILVDLSGHSLGNRLLAFARKPAPVQITWLGYLNTTGMLAMDYRLTDYASDPPTSDHWYRERLLRMPQSQWCYVPEAGPIAAPAVLPQPRPEGRPILFGCMTRFMKINDAMAGLWIRILDAVPGAKLRIIDVPNHNRARMLKRCFEETGTIDRVEFLPTLREGEYWETLQDIDIALDTFPYTGATTTCDCLWMGIPVVTRTGGFGAARSATSLLAAMGLDDLCAQSPEEYVATASALGRDHPRLSALRAGLRQRMLASPVCDPILFTSSLEGWLEQAWSNWCAGASSSV